MLKWCIVSIYLFRTKSRIIAIANWEKESLLRKNWVNDSIRYRTDLLRVYLSRVLSNTERPKIALYTNNINKIEVCVRSIILRVCNQQLRHAHIQDQKHVHVRVYVWIINFLSYVIKIGNYIAHESHSCSTICRIVYTVMSICFPWLFSYVRMRTEYSYEIEKCRT